MINMQQLLENSTLKLEQEFSINALQNMDLSNITKQDLLDTLVSASRRVHILENIVRELFKGSV